MQKEGYKTTEFWLASVVSLVALGAGTYSGNVWALLGSFVAAGAATAGYSLSRGKAKTPPMPDISLVKGIDGKPFFTVPEKQRIKD